MEKTDIIYSLCENSSKHPLWWGKEIFFEKYIKKGMRRRSSLDTKCEDILRCVFIFVLFRIISLPVRGNSVVL